MSQSPYVDGFEFVAAGASRSGRWPLHDLPRLHSSLAAHEGELDYALEGTQDPMGRSALRLRVRGVIRLSCQRCLETMDFPLDIDALLVLASSEAEIDTDSDDPSAPDRVLASREMPIRDLIEEEVLLSIPFAPRHERCDASSELLGAPRQSPFAGLSALLDVRQGAGRDRRR